MDVNYFNILYFFQADSIITRIIEEDMHNGIIYSDEVLLNSRFKKYKY